MALRRVASPAPPEPSDPLERARAAVLAGRWPDAAALIDLALRERSKDGLCEPLVLKLFLMLRNEQPAAALNIAKFLELSFSKPVIERALAWTAEAQQSLCDSEAHGSAALSLPWSQLLHEYLPGRVAEFERRPTSWPGHACAGERPLVVARIAGGLGNQLFQYAAALQWARRSGADLRLDLSHFEQEVRDDRQFCLHHFDVPLQLATPADYERVRTRRHVQDLSRFDRILIEGTGDVHLVGFWPSGSYFHTVADEIRALYRLRNREIGEYSRRYVAALRRPGSDIVALHVRRGDYVHPTNRNEYKYMQPEYYQRAARMFPPGTTFLLFTDTTLDMEWCKANIVLGPEYRLAYSEAHSFLFDFALMQTCDHAITSVSSFSWWAAWLNPNPGKIVINPPGIQGTGAVGAHYRQDERWPPEWVTLATPAEQVMWW